MFHRLRTFLYRLNHFIFKLYFLNITIINFNLNWSII